MSPLVFVLAFLPGVPSPQEDPEPWPVEAWSSVAPLGEDGRLRLDLAFRAREELPDLLLRVAIDHEGELLHTEEVAPETPTSRWRVGASEHLSLVLVPPLEGVEGGDPLFLRLGFARKAGGPARPPLEHLAAEDGLGEIPDFLLVPAFGGSDGSARLNEAFVEADRLRDAREVRRLWDHLERVHAEAVLDATKSRVLQRLAEAAKLLPPRQTELEQAVVARRIAREKTRYFREAASRLLRQGQRHGALRLLEAAGGVLEQDGGEAVLGELDEAERVLVSLENLREGLLRDLSRGDEDLVASTVRDLGRNRALVERAEELVLEGRAPVALALMRKIRRADGPELYAHARERIEAIGDEWLAATPAEEERAVEEVVEHPAWDRLEVVESHRFLFLGPKELVRGIPKESWRRFDLAYVALTDLFQHRPNPEGDRITVFFKELWDFGGGVGGGKIIDIGRAEPDPARATRVDNGLLYHELTHCIENMTPDFAGFSEGLANLGAAYAFERLDQKADALHSFDRNLFEFRRYFVERDLEYWRIQNYGPSAGFFLHFVDTYSLRQGSREHDWAPLRRFFSEYRDAPVHDGREPQVVRGLAHYLVRAFGRQAFQDLLDFGFPLDPRDEDLLRFELESFALDEVERFAGEFESYPTSPLPRDLVVRQHRSDLDHKERAVDWRRNAGVIADWKTIGPFFAERADPAACVFRPETFVDFDLKVRSLRESRADTTQLIWQDPLPTWKRVSGQPSVRLHPSGWVSFDYQPYGDDNSAIYALTHVTVPAETEARVHFRGDDEVTVFVGHRRLGTYEGRGANGSSNFVGWRGPFERVPDAMSFPVRLDAGRTPILVKIRNRRGDAGFILAVTRPDGRFLEFEADADPPRPEGARPPVEVPEWKRVASLDHRSIKSRARVEVGSFRSRRKAFQGTSQKGEVGWRRFTVRPGFPQDSPSNLLWLKEPLTEDLEDLRIELTLVPERTAPKLALTFQGEGGQDSLSGWTLVLVPHSERRVSARLERYDRLVYQTDPLPMPFGEEEESDDLLVLEVYDGWCSVELGGVKLFDRVSIQPIQGKHRVGLATWGPDTTVRALELFRSR